MLETYYDKLRLSELLDLEHGYHPSLHWLKKIQLFQIQLIPKYKLSISVKQKFHLDPDISNATSF